MGLYTGQHPNLQGVAVERVTLECGVAIDLFDVFRDGACLASDLTFRQVQQVLERIESGVPIDGRTGV